MVAIARTVIAAQLDPVASAELPFPQALKQSSQELQPPVRKAAGRSSTPATLPILAREPPEHAAKVLSQKYNVI